MTSSQSAASCSSLDAQARAALRAAMTSRRLALAPAERAALSARAQKRLLRSPAWAVAHSIALYVAVRGETDTALLLRAAWSTGKTVLLPRCAPEQDGRMHMVACPGQAFLRPGAYNIPEPLPECPLCDPPELIVLPGAAFDRRGCRLGMGGGYYDRLLARPDYANARRIGLAYEFQLVDRLCCAPWDIPVHAVCTERAWHEAGS